MTRQIQKPQHAICALLHLALLGRIRSYDANFGLRVVGSACSLVLTAYHSLLAAACEWSSVSDALDTHWLTNSLARLRTIFILTHLMSLGLTASRNIVQSSNRFEGTKLAAVNVPMLASACCMWWVCNIEEAADGIESVFTKYLAFNGVGVAVPWLAIHAATGSSAMAGPGYPICFLVISATLLRNTYSLDVDSPVIPRIAEDTIDLHWAAPLVFALMNSAALIIHAAVSHAVLCHWRRQPSQSLPPTVASAPRKARARAAALWVQQTILGLIPPINVAASITIPLIVAYSSSRTTTGQPWHGRLRELLSTYVMQEGSSTQWWWWGAACCAVCALMLLMVVEPPSLCPFIEFLYGSHCRTPAGLAPRTHHNCMHCPWRHFPR